MSPELTATAGDALLERDLGPGCFQTREVSFERGAGARLWDAEGREYIDCTAAYGVASLGHAHPALVQTIQAQAAKLASCTPAFANSQRTAYYQELLAALPQGLFERVFLCNSGTEAVEAALKFARLATGRSEVVACLRAFHGRTMGALSATHDRKYREPFAPLVPGFTHVPFNKESGLASITEATAAVIVEVVQGEGGVRVGDAEFLRALAARCREQGALLIVDEVQTGFGRTGRLFAIEHFGLEPDLLCLAKGMAGGFPMGGVAIGTRVGALAPGSHGSTFGGNPLACAVARQVLRSMREEQLVERAHELGEWFMNELRGIHSDQIREVRGRGLMIGIELTDRAAPVVAALLERGIVALVAGPRVVRFLPPLVIEREQLVQVRDAVAEVLA